jgi:hypothetical protein
VSSVGAVIKARLFEGEKGGCLKPSFLKPSNLAIDKFKDSAILRIQFERVMVRESGSFFKKSLIK